MNDIAPTEGVYLRFFVHENRRHGGVLMYEWLLAEAKKLGLPGGTAFRSIAGYGQHGVTHEAHFLELAGQETVRVDFVVTRELANTMLERVRSENLQLFYATLPTEFGTLGAGQP
ncbi:MAG TPA: DUF190 domain-containing protein [Rhodanobacteraceae bacterium]|jgi:PII-like signaling protein|nr:DUF190 domain-containing protein [Rhodanobacteraceae bacterium]